MILRGNLYSKKLEMNTSISTIIPNDFKEGKKYRVAYVLHGIHGDNDTWIESTMLPIYAREKDIIFVMPSAQRSFYTDTHSGQKYFSYVADELPVIMKSILRISAKKEDTAIIGCSMGGYGALKIGLSRPETFGYVAAFSSALLYIKDYQDAVRTEEQRNAQRASWGDQMMNDMLAIFGPKLEYSFSDDVLELAKKVAKLPSSPKLYMACGYDDFLYKDNIKFAEEVSKFYPDFTYQEWNGEHDWHFFNQAIEKAVDMFDKMN